MRASSPASLRGFTLIEVIAVIMIVSVLAAISIPKFVDLSQAARQASAESIAGALSSASSLNYSTFIITKHYPDAPLYSAVPVLNCSDAAGILEGGLPTGYKLEGSGGGSGAVGHLARVECDIVDLDNNAYRASFGLYGVNPVGP